MIAQLKIKYKLILINLFSVLTVVLIVGGFWVYDGAKKYENYLLKRISSQGQLVARNSTAAIIFEDWEEAKIILSALSTDQAISSARIIKNDEVLLMEQYSEDIHHEGINFYAVFGHKIHNGTLAFPVDGNDEFAIEINYQDQELHEAIYQSLCLVMFMLVLSLLIAITLSMLLQSFVTKPIQNLSEVAKQVTRSKSYSTRGKFYYPDEIGSLTNDFNEMLELVEEKDLHMEETISRRTGLLKEQNIELAFQITEREKSEKAHRESEEKFEQAFLNAPIGMALINVNKEVTQHNRALDKTLNSNDNKTLFLDDFIGANYIDEVSSNFRLLIAGEISWFEREVECYSNQGELLNAILSFSAVSSEKNEFMYAVLQLQDITESKKLSERLEYQAKHDALTGLANRRVLKYAINEIIVNKGANTHALCLLDLDQFKVVNDTCGHAAGDELLRQLAHLLMDEIDKNDLVVRLGGDEFGVVFYHCDKTDLIIKAEFLRRVIEQWKFMWNGQTFRVGVSIGAVIIGEHPLDYSNLMQQADAACFIAKDMGRNQVYIAAGEEDQKISLRQGEMLWVQRIHHALQNDYFMLFTQPVIDLHLTHSEDKYEVLLRMRNNDTEELIPPGAFIPAAERYGLSIKIDSWVVSALIKMLQGNPGQVTSSYWVNLSGVSLGDSNFLLFLEKSIKESGLPPGTLNFEITETAVMQNIGLAKSVMNRLIKLGSRFALDDFGSGISSFGYLKQLPVSIIKIDGMFVRDILSDEIDLIFVKSIIDIAKLMGIKTVAEFVESIEIKEKLIEIGADFGQGFALGEPMLIFKHDSRISNNEYLL